MPAMIQSVPILIGLRYIRAKRRNSFISFVSIFAFAGMALGVLALVVVLSVMNGFDQELKARILRVVPHGHVTGLTPIKDWQALQNQIAQVPELLGAAPVVSGHGLMTFSERVKGVQVEGIDPTTEVNVSDVHQFMLFGQMDTALQPGQYNVVLGSLLARYLRVTVGDKVSLTLPSYLKWARKWIKRSRLFISKMRKLYLGAAAQWMACVCGLKICTRHQPIYKRWRCN